MNESEIGKSTGQQATDRSEHAAAHLLIRVQPIDKESIDANAIELLDLSRDFEGEYDGWEAQVVTQ